MQSMLRQQKINTDIDIAQQKKTYIPLGKICKMLLPYAI